jgi:hypothetical protein
MNAAPTNRELAEVARNAAYIIVKHGKATGTFRDAYGRVCAVHALALAERAGEVGGGETICLRCEVAVAAPWPSSGLAVWSDLATTTEADIAAVFLQVADDLEVAP